MGRHCRDCELIPERLRMSITRDGPALSRLRIDSFPEATCLQHSTGYTTSMDGMGHPREVCMSSLVSGRVRAWTMLRIIGCEDNRHRHSAVNSVPVILSSFGLRPWLSARHMISRHLMHV